MVQVVQLGALVLGLGWLAAEIQLGGKAAENPHGPEWRRTSEGWIKVGHAGAAALDLPDPQPALEPTLHPAILTVFMLLSGVLSLSLFDQWPVSSPFAFSRNAPARRSEERSKVECGG